MKTGFKVSSNGLGGADIGDLYVPKSFFTKGSLWGWGNNTNGVIGDSSTNSKSSPVQTAVGGVAWRSVSTTDYSKAMLSTDGSVWNVGAYCGNDLALGGYATSPIKLSGIDTWKQVCAGPSNNAAIRSDGTLWSWGYNYYGNLGDNTTIHRSSPAQVVRANGDYAWKQVTLGHDFSAAIDINDMLHTWGDNRFGRLGVIDSPDRSQPFQVGIATWKQISAGYEHCVGIQTNGTLWTWGDNEYGQLGQGDQGVNTDRSSPVQVGAGTDWKFVSCGGSPYNTAAIKTNGTLWAWGSNQFGQLGRGDRISASSPVQVGASNNWRTCDIGNSSTTAIKVDGTLWAWGANSNGGVGDGTVIDRSSPVQIGSGSNWMTVSSSSAITSDGDLT